MPGPATAATIAAVRRGWDAGERVHVVSYRTGAAPLSVPVSGPLAGWRLEQVRRHLGGPDQVVLGLQAGVPFSSPGRFEQLGTALGLAVAMRRFRRATILVGEDPGVSPACMQALARAVGRISVATARTPTASWSATVLFEGLCPSRRSTPIRCSPKAPAP